MWTEARLDQLLTQPSDDLVAMLEKLSGDIMILGAGGKMGPTLALLARNAVKQAGTNQKVIAVSRFSDPLARRLLEDHGVEMIPADLLNAKDVAQLPEVENIIYMVGRKFGTQNQAAETWALNAICPSLIAQKFKKSKIVVFSTGNVYPMCPASSGGSTEDTAPEPVGEYGMSALARERIFEYAAQAYGSKILILRLNYAVDLRYGILHDLAERLMQDKPISLRTPCFNCVWQGYANEVALRSLSLADSPAVYLNVTGPETVSVAYAARQLGRHLNRAVRFTDQPEDVALLSHAGACMQHFGYPAVSLNQLIRWQAEWILAGGRSLNKPTHFDERGGKY